jgi:hypothetical protein
MKSSMRWVGLYLLHLLAATFGVLLATAILLNVVLKPLEPWISHAKLVSIATGPYYALPIILAAFAGYFGYIRFKGNYRFWIWIVPTVYLVTKIILWTPTSVLAVQNWGTTLAHFFAGTPPHYYEGNVTMPFYTSLSYTLGALLDAGNVFRFQRPSEDAGRTGLGKRCHGNRDRPREFGIAWRGEIHVELEKVECAAPEQINKEVRFARGGRSGSVQI